MSSRPWRQVVSINSWRQDVLSIKKVASSRSRTLYFDFVRFYFCKKIESSLFQTNIETLKILFI